jgi:hypothetical protein
MNIQPTGNINFYENTGTTAKLVWDASAESLGIGTNSPDTLLEIASSAPKLYITNTNFTINDTDEYGSLDFVSEDGSFTKKPVARIQAVNTGGAGSYSALAFHTSYGTAAPLTIERMRITKDGDVLVGSTDDQPSNNSAGSSADNGLALKDNGELHVAAYKNTANSGSVGYFNRTSTDGTILDFLKDGATIGGITATQGRLAIGNGDTGLKFSDANESIMPFNVSTNANRDNAIDLGYTTVRFNDVYATNGTIQTSDQTEKQDIATLTSTEMLVGKRISALFKTFRWKDKVASKGDNARTHTGIIAQDVQAAFTAEGLDAGDYSLFISSTWLVDSEGNEVEEGTEDAVSKTRMGIRYPELLSFVAAYNEQRFANIETRLTTLEG